MAMPQMSNAQIGVMPTDPQALHEWVGSSFRSNHQQFLHQLIDRVGMQRGFQTGPGSMKIAEPIVGRGAYTGTDYFKVGENPGQNERISVMPQTPPPKGKKPAATGLPMGFETGGIIDVQPPQMPTDPTMGQPPMPGAPAQPQMQGAPTPVNDALMSVMQQHPQMSSSDAYDLLSATKSIQEHVQQGVIPLDKAIKLLNNLATTLINTPDSPQSGTPQPAMGDPMQSPQGGMPMPSPTGIPQAAPPQGNPAAPVASIVQPQTTATPQAKPTPLTTPLDYSTGPTSQVGGLPASPVGAQPSMSVDNFLRPSTDTATPSTPNAEGGLDVPDVVHGGVAKLDLNTVQAIQSLFPPELQQIAEYIAAAESKGNVNAVGGAGEIGLFQIHPVNWPGLSRSMGMPINAQTLRDPITNAKAALQLLKENNFSWKPWTTSPKVLAALGANP